MIVYNLDGLSDVAVDVSSILNVDDTYEVHEAQDWSGTPLLTGTYPGGTLTFPMAAVTAPMPVAGQGGGAAPTPPSTGTQFHAFLVLRTNP